MDKKVLGTITARGGSKRILKKSIVPVLGKPSMVYVIEAMKKAKLVNRLIVDTDSEEMAEIGKQNGAEIPFLRPAELAQDSTPHVPVLKYELEFLKKKEGYWPDAVCLVQPTSPLVTAEQIDGAIKLLFESGADSAETVFEAPTIFHPYNIRCIDDKGYTKFMFAEERARAQKEGKKPRVYSVGTVFAFRPENLWDTGTIQGKISKSVVIDRASAIDIDEPLDVLFAEAVLKSYKDK